MKKRIIFITGTDTGIGKTHITIGLLKSLIKCGYSAIAIKPVATGCFRYLEGLRNSDALLLQEVGSIKLPYEMINPFAFEPAIAPHLAASQINSTLTVESLLNRCALALSLEVDIILIEGVGGWLVPLNSHELMSDFVKQLNCETILVVGMRLGCLNHTLLTYQTMIDHCININSWIANGIDPDMICLEENIATLSQFLHMPLLGTIPFGCNAEDKINVDLFLGSQYH